MVCPEPDPWGKWGLDYSTRAIRRVKLNKGLGVQIQIDASDLDAARNFRNTIVKAVTSLIAYEVLSACKPLRFIKAYVITPACEIRNYRHDFSFEAPGIFPQVVNDLLDEGAVIKKRLNPWRNGGNNHGRNSVQSFCEL